MIPSLVATLKASDNTEEDSPDIMPHRLREGGVNVLSVKTLSVSGVKENLTWEEIITFSTCRRSTSDKARSG